MENDFNELQNLLREKAELNARLKLIPYDGSIETKEIKGKEYIYIRKREYGKNTSTYIGPFSDELYQVLLKGIKDAKPIKKSIREIEKRLASYGYVQDDLSPNVIMNLEFARANMKSIIYDQAILEGVATTFPDTELIIENGKVNNISASDVQKILNLKHAWEFILDKDVILYPSNFYVCQYIAKIVNEGFYQEGGRVRGVPVTIGGTSYVPPLPIEHLIKDDINSIISGNKDPIEISIELVLYIMKRQIFNDGNKRTAIIFANHYLIAQGKGLLVVPENKVSEFKKVLIEYYESDDSQSIKEFMRNKCLRKYNND